MPSHTQRYLEQTARIAAAIDHEEVERIVAALAELRSRGGRLFMLGVGGSAANCSHAVNDFRKIADIEAYSPTDNVAELTARTNDEGWPRVFDSWLRTSRAGPQDAIFILSVGGGDAQKQISVNLIAAIDEAQRRGMKVYGIVGRAESYTKRMGDAVIVVPIEDQSLLTPHAEAFQSVILHAMVCHPLLMAHQGKWEEVRSPPGTGKG
jgi:D-sedoheptulose 7-phosphate isomerase